MPTPFIDDVSKVCGISTADLEKKWEAAKSEIKDSFPDVDSDSDRFFALVTGLFKKMTGKDCSDKLKTSSQECLLTDQESDDCCDEVKLKRVIRKGKIVKKAVCPPGTKFLNGRCVKILGREKINRKKAGKKTARKVRAKASLIKRKRAKSLKKRKRIGF